MKLIDLLVKELPARGGWPEGAEFCFQSAVDSEIYFHVKGVSAKPIYRFLPSEKNKCEDSVYYEITREQYEAAIKPRMISTGLHSGAYAQFCAAGWTDDQLVEHGYFRVAQMGEEVSELPGLSCEVIPSAACAHFSPEYKNQYEATISKPEIGVKHDSGKFRFSLLPWNAVKEVIDVLEFGAKKYAPDNWKRVDYHRDRYFNATIRHVTAWYVGEKNDPETGLNHLAHAVCCLLFLIWFDKNEQN